MSGSPIKIFKINSAITDYYPPFNKPASMNAIRMNKQATPRTKRTDKRVTPGNKRTDKQVSPVPSPATSPVVSKKASPRMSKAIHRLNKEASRPLIVEPVFTSDEFAGVKGKIRKAHEDYLEKDATYQQALRSEREGGSISQAKPQTMWEDPSLGMVFGSLYCPCGCCDYPTYSEPYDPVGVLTKTQVLGELADEAYWDSLALEHDLEYTIEDYQKIPTYTAEEKSSKGFKKDRKRWNHPPTQHKGKAGYKGKGNRSKSDKHPEKFQKI
jgi:hypothetical protein